MSLCYSHRLYSLLDKRSKHIKASGLPDAGKIKLVLDESHLSVVITLRLLRDEASTGTCPWNSYPCPRFDPD